LSRSRVSGHGRKWGVKMHGLARMRCTCAASLSALAWSRSMAGSRHALSRAASTRRSWVPWSRSPIRAVRLCSLRASRSIGTRPTEDARAWLRDPRMASAVALDVPHVVYQLAPNKRLKLTAPVIRGRIPFVIIPVRRRSLGAPR